MYDKEVVVKETFWREPERAVEDADPEVTTGLMGIRVGEGVIGRYGGINDKEYLEQMHLQL